MRIGIATLENCSSLVTLLSVYIPYDCIFHPNPYVPMYTMNVHSSTVLITSMTETSGTPKLTVARPVQRKAIQQRPAEYDVPQGMTMTSVELAVRVQAQCKFVYLKFQEEKK